MTHEKDGKEKPEHQPNPDSTQTAEEVKFYNRERAEFGGRRAFAALSDGLTILRDALAAEFPAVDPQTQESRFPENTAKINGLTTAIERLNTGLVAVSFKKAENGTGDEYLIGFIDRNAVNAKGVPTSIQVEDRVENPPVTVMRYRPSDGNLLITEVKAAQGKVLVPSEAPVIIGFYSIGKNAYRTMFLPHREEQAINNPGIATRINGALEAITLKYDKSGLLANPEAFGLVRPGRRLPPA